MSMENVATLKRMSREQLSSLLLSPDASKVAIIDVRDDDHVGGHIKSSTHVPSSSLDYRIPEIVRTMAGKEIVIFHCALSQQRGPTAASKYIRDRESKMKMGNIHDKPSPPAIGVRKGGIQKVSSPASKGQELRGEINKVLESQENGITEESSLENPSPESREQEVFVLDMGFVGWQEKYGKDQRLTEAYAEDIWTNYY